MMDQIDHIAQRITIAACAGLFIGASVATFRGSPIHKTSLSVALSCALTSTACLVPERLAYNAIIHLAPPEIDAESKIYASHTLGGLFGGGISGGLFQGRPFGGIMLFTPILLTVAYAEIQKEKHKKARIRVLNSEIKETEVD
uniref:Uncharacterized protein n=1 Tax=Eucampia antarctica TaxID=49252 RepID=A0A7S2S7H6_9STRA|mmetsp:Transcript_3453/g.3265  ORF Transcript_3453/g.3265 Transcript_3453/m.3265 type:complete len:143 (+) Transcript_3453:67-495(+)